MSLAAIGSISGVAGTGYLKGEFKALGIDFGARNERFDEALKPVGLTNGQFSLLMALNRPEPASMGPVARTVHGSQPMDG